MDEVKSHIVKFVWKNKRPKVKYTTMISDSDQGGINLPDFETRVKSQQLLWIKRLKTNNENQWKIIPLYYLSGIGGPKQIGSNFDFNAIPKQLPSFYSSCLKTWSHFVDVEPKSKPEVLIQPLWNNSKIRCKLSYMKALSQNNINLIREVKNENGEIMVSV